MLHIAKAQRLKMPWTSVLSALLFAAILALLPTIALAQCAKWDAGREMLIVQPGFQSRLTLEQNGPVITGKALGSVQEEDGTRTITGAGTVDGTFDGNNFSIQIYWYNDHTGVYNGKVLPSGRLDGEGYEKRSPNVRVPWHSESVLKCVPPKPAPPPPIRSSGKMRKSDPAPAPALTPPWIRATPAVFPAPSVPTGFVVLTWDAGPEHPNAEIWLKTPSGIQTVAKQPKGGLQIAVERGRFYEYDIGDAGRIWAGVTFTAIGP